MTIKNKVIKCKSISAQGKKLCYTQTNGWQSHVKIKEGNIRLGHAPSKTTNLGTSIWIAHTSKVIRGVENVTWSRQRKLTVHRKSQDQ